MAPWKDLEEKRAKAVACKERRKISKFEDRERSRRENRPWEEATTFVERFDKRMNSDSRSDSWSWEERMRIRNEIRADISREYDKLAQQNKRDYDELVERNRRVSFEHVVKKVSWDESTNDSAQSLEFSFGDKNKCSVA